MSVLGVVEQSERAPVYVQKTLYSLVLLFVRVLIHPCLTFTPSILVPTWHTFPLLDFFHLMSWNKCPIRFRHLIEPRGFGCSITALTPRSPPPLLKLCCNDMLLCCIGIFGSSLLFSHEAAPLSSNLMDMNESSWLLELSQWYWSSDFLCLRSRRLSKELRAKILGKFMGFLLWVKLWVLWLLLLLAWWSCSCCDAKTSSLSFKHRAQIPITTSLGWR